MAGQVKGVLFGDYVRMLRAFGGREWETCLQPEDVVLLEQRIDPSGWYPMATFERLGLAILNLVAGGDLEVVREWGQRSVAHVAGTVDQLVVPGDPRESLMRFQVFRRTFFDFEALAVLELSDGSAALKVDYGMSAVAEEAASVQTLGFFVGLLQLAGGTSVRGELTEKSWKGDASTLLSLLWDDPASSP
jgi:hypothetical protein